MANHDILYNILQLLLTHQCHERLQKTRSAAVVLVVAAIVADATAAVVAAVVAAAIAVVLGL